MIKKCIAYQKMLNYNLANENKDRRRNAAAMAFAWFLMMVIGMGDCWRSFCIYSLEELYGILIFYWIGVRLTQSVSSRMLKSTPVSDRFAVAGIIFGIPVCFGGLLFIGFFVIGGLFAAILEGRFDWIFYIRETNIAGGIFSFMIAMGNLILGMLCGIA